MSDNPFMDMAEGKLFGMRRQVAPPPAPKPLSQYVVSQPPPAPRLEPAFEVHRYQMAPIQQAPRQDDLFRAINEMRKKVDVLYTDRKRQESGKSKDEILQEQEADIRSQLDVLDGESKQILEQMGAAIMFQTSKGDKPWEELRGMFVERVYGGYQKEALDIAQELIDGAKELLLLSFQNAKNFERRYQLMLGVEGQLGMVAVLKERIKLLEDQLSEEEEEDDEVNFRDMYQKLVKTCAQRGYPIDFKKIESTTEEESEEEEEAPPTPPRRQRPSPRPPANAPTKPSNEPEDENGDGDWEVKGASS